MKLRLAGALVLVAGAAALASASAYAGNGNGNGNGHGNGNGKSEPAAAPEAAASQESAAPGNSADAPGQLKKDEAPVAAVAAPVSSVVDAGTNQVGVKPGNDTAHDTHAAASSDKTKLYGNGKTAGQIAMQNGAAAGTVLHGPGNSQPHKAAPCSGGHEVDVHALKGNRAKTCGGQVSSPPTPRPNPTPDPAKPGGDPAHGPTDKSENTPVVLPTSPADPSKPTQPKPAVSPQQGSVEMASGVLSATGAIGGGALPFTGFPIWVVVLIALALLVLGLMLRRRSGATSS